MRIGLSIIASCLIAGSAIAQTSPTAEAGSYAAAKTELASRYVRAIRADRMMRVMIEEQVAALIESRRDTLDPQYLTIYREVVSAKLDLIMPELEARMVKVMMRTLSEEELQTLVVFWESPVGRSVTEKRASGAAYTEAEANALHTFYAGPGKIMTPGKNQEIMTATAGEMADLLPRWVEMVRDGVCERWTCQDGKAVF